LHVVFCRVLCYVAVYVAVFLKSQFFEKKKSREILRFERSFAGFLELLT